MPDGSKIVSESDDNTIQILDASTGIDVLSLLQYHDKDISSVAFSPDGSKILSKFDYGAIQVWNVSTGVKFLPSQPAAVDDVLKSAPDC